MAIFGIPFGESAKARSQTSAADLAWLLRRQQDLLDLVSNSAGVDQIIKHLVEFADESFRPARCAIFELDPDLGLVRRFSADQVTDDVSGSALDSLKAILNETNPSLVPGTDISIATALVDISGGEKAAPLPNPFPMVATLFAGYLQYTIRNPAWARKRCGRSPAMWAAPSERPPKPAATPNGSKGSPRQSPA